MVSVIGSPQSKVMPGYNPNKFYLDSDNKAEPKFRYLVEVFNWDGDKMFEEEIIPDINNQYGILDLSTILQNKLSGIIIPSFTDFYLTAGVEDAPDSYFRYTLKLGEIFVTDWLWDEFGYAGVGNWPNATDPQYNPNGYAKTMLYTESMTNQPPYQNGDTITVSLNSGTQDRPSIAGVHKVLDVVDSNSPTEWYVVIDLEWVGSGTSTGGKTEYSDGTRSVFKDQVVNGANTLINTALNKTDWLSWDMSDYNMTKLDTFPRKQQWLSNLDESRNSNKQINYTVREDNRVILQFMTDYSNLQNEDPDEIPDVIRFTNDSGTSEDIPTNLTYLDDERVHLIDCSYKRTFTNTTLLDNTDYYTVQIWKTTGPYAGTVSESVRFNVNRECGIDGGDNMMELLYMDSFGSMLPFNFTHRNEESFRVTKRVSEDYLGGRVNDEYVYDLTEGGKVIYSQDYSTHYKLRSGFLTKTESIFFKYLFRSPVTFIKIDGNYHRCIIDSTSLKVKEGSIGLKQYDINVTLSHKNTLNI